MHTALQCCGDSSAQILRPSLPSMCAQTKHHLWHNAELFASRKGSCYTPTKTNIPYSVTIASCLAQCKTGTLLRGKVPAPYSLGWIELKSAPAIAQTHVDARPIKPQCRPARQAPQRARSWGLRMFDGRWWRSAYCPCSYASTSHPAMDCASSA